MTLWKDKIDYSSNPISYSTFGSATRKKGKDQLGDQERIENLKWARDHCDGRMRVVTIEAVDVNAEHRRIARSFPQKRMVMKLTGLNETTGEFSAVNESD
jgi:hypothetical protein